jgi:signal transduction histidine kinase
MRKRALNFPESAEILKELLDDIPTAVVIVDKNVVVRMYNKAFGNIFVESGHDAVGKFCGNAMNCSFTLNENTDCGKTTQCESCNLRNSFIQTLIKKESPREKISKDYYLHDKIQTRHYYYTTKRITFDDEEMIMVIIDDITELEEKNRELFELNEKKNEFMRIAAHDIRNPISTIFTISDLLISDQKSVPAAKKQEFLKYIRSSASFSISLLNDLLDFSVLESGGSKLNIQANDYIEQLDHITETYRYIAANKKIRILLIVKIDISKFQYDSNRIEQVLHNLLSNAVKYSPERSTITISVTIEDNFIITRIDDQGQGIEANDIEKIFKPFHKGTAKTTGGEKSTGLGLSICKLIVLQHKGEIWVESVKGKGSSFYFKLPYNIQS